MAIVILQHDIVNIGPRHMRVDVRAVVDGAPFQDFHFHRRGPVAATEPTVAIVKKMIRRQLSSEASIAADEASAADVIQNKLPALFQWAAANTAYPEVRKALRQLHGLRGGE